ncbi:hypothetical protein AVEN_99254-1 [Araneus ventricosus]|uniref:Uncharacterized protein n=1 Tax=Araneus ventricosus TaxID=182803 RepID=A0A4Y2W060_ARAVE|nr:hypothetical protein AVEN_99254-1 [Araneus ventricosus]
MHEKSHAIIRLPVHLPDMQPVYFYHDEERQALERAAQRNTMLTAWFELNRTDPDANRYFYSDIPKHFVWINGRDVYDSAIELCQGYIPLVQKTLSGFISGCFCFMFREPNLLRSYEPMTAL